VLGILGLFRAGWLTAASYRVRMIVSVLGMMLAVVPLFFVSRAMQPLMQQTIRNESPQYFGFLLIGMTCMTFLPLAVASVPNAVNSAINTGTFESLLETPMGIGAALAGLVSYEVVFVVLRSLFLMLAGAVLGAAIVWTRVPLAFVILCLIVAAHIPFGLIAAAGVLAFRTAGPLPQGVLVLSGLLGGVYYPTHVIPGWLETVANFVPLSYGLRALRQVLTLAQVDTQPWRDVGVMMLASIPLWVIGGGAFAIALRRAQQNGNLSRY